VTWIQVRDSDPESTWVLTLRRLMGDEDTDRALAVMVRALLWTAKNVPDGDLKGYDLLDLAWAWRLKIEVMPMLVEAGILLANPEGYAMGADYLARTEKMRTDRARKAAEREAKRAEDSPERVRGQSADGPTPVRARVASRSATTGDQDLRDPVVPTPAVVTSDPVPRRKPRPRQHSTLTAAQTEWLTAVAAAWTEGVEGTAIPAASPPSARTAPRDQALLDARTTYPEPDDWLWCARALAADPFYRGENDRGWVARLTWLLGKKDRGVTLATWMEAGQARRNGKAKAPPLVTRPLAPGEGTRQLTAALDRIAPQRELGEWIGPVPARGVS
jgi:hypothetical protein